MLKYKEAGAKVEVVGKETLGGKDAIVLAYTPKTGSALRLYLDARTWQLIRSVAKVNVPEAGGDMEQTTDSSDYRDVDGLKVPFTLVVTSPTQTVTITFKTVEHNKPIDDAVFGRAGK